MDEFYCGSCGTHKKLSALHEDRSGRRPICKSCFERKVQAAKKGNKRRKLNEHNIEWLSRYTCSRNL